MALLKLKPLTSELERDVRRLKDQRRRLLAAFLALREVKSLGNDPESAIIRLQGELLNLPHRVSHALEHEEDWMIRRILLVEIWRILSDFEERLSTIGDIPRTPAYARYIQADRELRPGDLEDDE